MNTDTPAQTPTCSCDLGYPLAVEEFLPDMFLPVVPYSFPSKVKPECEVHGEGTFYARIEALAEALHEGDWTMQAGEWRYTEATLGRRMATRALVEPLLGYQSSEWIPAGFISVVATSYATRGARGPVPLNDGRARAKVAAVTKALAQDVKQVHERDHIHNSCPTHCCTDHGCKYGYDDCCPVVTGQAAPVYPENNGCEMCEHDLEDV